MARGRSQQAKKIKMLLTKNQHNKAKQLQQTTARHKLQTTLEFF